MLEDAHVHSGQNAHVHSGQCGQLWTMWTIVDNVDNASLFLDVGQEARLHASSADLRVDVFTTQSGRALHVLF